MVEICDGMIVMQNKYILIISNYRRFAKTEERGGGWAVLGYPNLP
jgi:hypothetical protein